MKRIKVLSVFGTRPEAIKMAPLVLELEKQKEEFESVVVVTAQHREMLDQVLQIFNIEPDYDLNIMKKNQSLSRITESVLNHMEKILVEENPDIILVHGDTTTAYASALAAFYQKINIGHVEAGLRTSNKYSPYPEEMNRKMIDALADIYFIPTIESRENLISENYSKNLCITGNTVIDALKWTVKTDYENDILNKIDPDKKIILLTMHRRENSGQPMRNVFEAIKQIVEEDKNLEVIYPVHLNPQVQQTAEEILGETERIHLIDPLDVVDFHNIASRSFLILTDSGGIQEEAPSLGVPVLVLRDTSERPEGIKAGTLKLIGTNREDVYRETKLLLTNEKIYKKMSEAVNPYGDGTASKQILESIKTYFEKRD